MEIEIEITRDDFKEFNKFVSKKLDKKIMLPYFVFLIFLVSIINITTGLNARQIITSLITTALILFVLWLIFKIVRNFISKKLPSKKGTIVGKHKFTISDQGLLESTDYNETLTKWNGIQSVETNNKYIFVFIDRILAHVIPKRYFNSESECEKFLSDLKDKTRKSKIS